MSGESEIPPEVFEAVDRVAAAFMRNDFNYARELVNDYRERWEADGRKQQLRNQEKARDVELEMRRRGNAWFVTKDGLRVLDEIRSGNGAWPYVWKRACKIKPIGLLASDKPSLYTGPEVRTYELTRTRDDNGLPTYLET